MTVVFTSFSYTQASTSKIEFKLKDEDEDYGMTPFVGLGKAKQSTSEAQSAIDVTAEDLIDRLSPQNVADLVLLSMVCTAEMPLFLLFQDFLLFSDFNFRFLWFTVISTQTFVCVNSKLF